MHSYSLSTYAFKVMAHIGGKMCIFQGSLPSLGEGRLKHRENPRLLGTEKEHTLFHAGEMMRLVHVLHTVLYSLTRSSTQVQCRVSEYSTVLVSTVQC
jgi:hypothetical protein